MWDEHGIFQVTTTRRRGPHGVTDIGQRVDEANAEADEGDEEEQEEAEGTEDDADADDGEPWYDSNANEEEVRREIARRESGYEHERDAGAWLGITESRVEAIMREREGGAGGAGGGGGLSNAVATFDWADRKFGPSRRDHSRALFNCLRSFPDFRTFDRRDHVYAILGLWQRFGRSSELPDILKPDYTTAVWEVFGRAARYAMQDCGDLSPLGLVSETLPKPEDDSWPSWIPR